MQTFKVGEFVMTPRGKGEVLYYNNRIGDYLIGIKGFDGHSGSCRCEKLVEEKGYINQCWWFDKYDVKKLDEKDTNNQEMIVHPDNYNTSEREIIKEMRLMFGDEAVVAFCKLNTYKYIRRACHKDNKKEDMKKAELYMDYLKKMGVK